MDLKKPPKFLHAYQTPILVVLALFLVWILVVFFKGKDSSQEYSGSQILPMETATTTISYTLPKRSLSEFERIRVVIDQEIAFERAMMQEENAIINTVPEIGIDSFARVKNTLENLPADTQKNFCERFVAFSKTLSTTVDETKENVQKLFITRDKKLQEERSKREVRIKRNRDLRDTQLNTHFSRIEKLVTASSTTHVNSIRTDIINTVQEIRHQTDILSNQFFSDVSQQLNAYITGTNDLFSSITPKITQILSDGKNDCAKSTSPRVVRLSAHAGLSVVLGKNLEIIVQNTRYPKEQLLLMVQTKETQQGMQIVAQDTLKTRLDSIIESISKK